MWDAVIKSIGCVTAVAALGCAGAVGSGANAESGGRNAYVIERDVLVERDRSALDVMIGRVPNLRVTRTGQCPTLSLRGRSSVTQSSNPVIYLDGTRAANTCLLDGLRASDLSRVEVYPAGVVPGTGYATSGTGLIVLFSRRT